MTGLIDQSDIARQKPAIPAGNASLPIVHQRAAG